VLILAEEKKSEKLWCDARLTDDFLPVQVSALDQELIEVDPDTKEMLKLLVSLSVYDTTK